MVPHTWDAGVRGMTHIIRKGRNFTKVNLLFTMNLTSEEFHFFTYPSPYFANKIM